MRLMMWKIFLVAFSAMIGASLGCSSLQVTPHESGREAQDSRLPADTQELTCQQMFERGVSQCDRPDNSEEPESEESCRMRLKIDLNTCQRDEDEKCGVVFAQQLRGCSDHPEAASTMGGVRACEEEVEAQLKLCCAERGSLRCMEKLGLK